MKKLAAILIALALAAANLPAQTGTFPQHVAVSTGITFGASQMDRIVEADCTGGITLVLPSAASWENYSAFVVRTNANGTGDCTINTTSSQTIGATLTSYSLTVKGQFFWAISNNANWNLASQKLVADAGASHNFLTAISESGIISKAQPAISDLTATFSAPLNLSTNTLSITGVAGQVLAGSTPAFTAAPTIGETAAPSAPASSNGIWWIDSTDHRFHDKNPSNAIGTTVVADAGATHNFLTSISADGVVSHAQPAIADLSDGFSLVASGTGGTGPSKAGTAATAARSDHDHRSISQLIWFFPGVTATGVQNMTLTFPETAVNFAILDMRVTVNTTSTSSSTFNIQRCTASCTGTTPTFADIYSTVLTLSANTRTTTKGSAPNQNVSSLTNGDQFKASLVTIGSLLADVTITMTYKFDTTN